jgi:putative ABC transport system permease protein
MLPSSKVSGPGHPSDMTRNVGAVLAVASTTAVLALCLAVGPLYLSSVGSAAIEVQLAAGCLDNKGVQIPISEPARDFRVAELRAELAHIPDAGKNYVARQTRAMSLTTANGTARAVFVSREGFERDIELVAGSTTRGVVVPDDMAKIYGLAPGSKLSISPGAGYQVPATVAGTYRSLVSPTPPPEWCAAGELLRPGLEPPPPMILMDESTMESLGGLNPYGPVRTTLIVVPRATGMTLARAERLNEQLLRLKYSPDPVPDIARRQSGLPSIVLRTAVILRYVSANIGPIRWAAGLVGLAVVATAAVLYLRRRRTELITLSVRGRSPLRLGAGAAVGLAAPAFAGAAVGYGASIVAVRLWGPSPVLQASAFAAAIRWALAGWGLAVATVAVVVTLGARRLIDGPAASARHPLRFVPWELVPVGLAVFAATRLGDSGGVQLLGAVTTRVDAWALGFPLLAMVAVVAVVARPWRAVLARRRTGKLRPAILIASRRLQSDRHNVVIAAGTAALAVAAAVYAALATDSAGRALHDKARTFIGAETSFVVYRGTPSIPDLGAPSTIVDRSPDAHSDSASVQVIGVDRATFAAAAFWRSDFGPSLPSLLDSLGPPDPDGALPAIVAGSLPNPTLTFTNRDALKLRVVGRVAHVPGIRADTTAIVVDRAALEASPVSYGTEVWTKSADVDGAARVLKDADVRVFSVYSAPDIFDNTSFLAVRWSLRLLRALGVLGGMVVVAIELSIIDARRRARQLTHLFAARMGLTAAQGWTVVAIEMIPPLFVGASVGSAAAIAVARASVARLDTIQSVPPVALLAPIAPALLSTAIVVAVAALATVVWARAQTVRADPVELLRG